MSEPITDQELTEWRAVVEKADDWDEFASFVRIVRTALPRLIDEVEAGRREIERLSAENVELRKKDDSLKGYSLGGNRY